MTGVQEPAPRTRRERRRRARGRGWIVAAVLLVIAVVAGGVAWSLVGDRVGAALGWTDNDYDGDGNGTPVEVVIASGDIGSDIAATLADAGVTKSFDAFYRLLLAQETEPSFQPGTYSLEQEMSAAAALDALLDPANRTVSQVSFPEGVTLDAILERTADGTGVPLEELRAVAADHAALGVPAEAPSLEGYLFPAAYEFDPGTPARDMLQRMVDRMLQALDEAGVPAADRHRVLTVASLVQREARSAEDFPKVARVVYNRLDAGMMLQFDSTSHYGYRVAHGTETTGSVFTTDEERADDNPYNTYARTGLPIGPIAAPGDAAIAAALQPAEGPWLFFVAVDLETGETVFTETIDQHEAAVEQLRQWCARSENADYCA